MHIFEDFMPFCCKNIPNIIWAIWYVCFGKFSDYLHTKMENLKFGMYFVFGWEEKFDINTYHILIIHFGNVQGEKSD